jgi:protein SCO1/2
MSGMIFAAPRAAMPLIVIGVFPVLVSIVLAQESSQARPHLHDAGASARPVELDRYDSLGGEFALMNQDEQPVRLSDHRGKVVLLFFGYIHCRDVCPLTAAKVAQAMQLLGEQREAVRFLFITTDPERDTAQQLKEWLSQFDPRFVGLRGTAAQLAGVEKRYGVFHTKLPSNAGDDSYDVNHTSRLFLIDQQGRVRYLFTPDQPAGSIVAGVRLLLKPEPWWARLLRAFGE